MAIFLTEYRHTIEGQKYAGPRIDAETWDEAQREATLLGLVVVGMLEEGV